LDLDYIELLVVVTVISLSLFCYITCSGNVCPRKSVLAIFELLPLVDFNGIVIKDV